MVRTKHAMVHFYTMIIQLLTPHSFFHQTPAMHQGTASGIQPRHQYADHGTQRVEQNTRRATLNFRKLPPTIPQACTNEQCTSSRYQGQRTRREGRRHNPEELQVYKSGEPKRRNTDYPSASTHQSLPSSVQVGRTSASKPGPCTPSYASYSPASPGLQTARRQSWIR